MWMVCLMAASCGRPDQASSPPAPTAELDQQVKRLRTDHEVQLRDLRGRWLAAEGTLTRVRDTLKQVEERGGTNLKQLEHQITGVEVALGHIVAEIEALKRKQPEPTDHPPEVTELDRLKRSYEEIHCLQKRGALEGVADVYRRYDFLDADAWAAAWSKAARSEAFERDVSARVERLCP